MYDNEREDLEIISMEFNLKYLLAILNSKFAYFYLNSIRMHRLKNYFYPDDLKELLIKIIPFDGQKKFIENVNQIIDKNNEFAKEISSFHKYLISDFNVIKINKKLTECYTLSFDELYKEVKKQYKQITRKEKDKLEKEYTLSLDIILPLQKEIAITQCCQVIYLYCV